MIYHSTKPNVFRDGYDEVADRISRLVRNARGERYCVYVDFEGTTRWVLRREVGARKTPPPDCDLIGTYDRHVRVETIEGDLIERMRELSKKRRAA